MAKGKAYNEAHKRAQLKYDAANIKQITLKLNKKTDADIIEKLGEVENKQGYIKQAIRKKMKAD